MGRLLHLKAIFLARRDALRLVALRRGETTEGRVGDVCTPEGTGERVDYGEGEGVCV